MEQDALGKLYQQNLEHDIILYLSEQKGIQLREAMDIYYKSELSNQIENGLFDIQFLDAKNLVLDLMENEAELFK